MKFELFAPTLTKRPLKVKLIAKTEVMDDDATTNCAIAIFDNTNVVNCQAVKSSQVIGNGKAPKYVLFGVEGINYWGEKTQLLGWYKTIDEIQEEIKKNQSGYSRGKKVMNLSILSKLNTKGGLGNHVLLIDYISQ